MADTLTKTLYLLGDAKRHLIPLTLLFFTSSFLELLSIGVLIPFMNYAIAGDLDIPYLSFSLGNSGVSYTLNTLCVLLVFVFTLKALFLFFVAAATTHFAQTQRVRMGHKLLSCLLKMDYLSFLQRREADGVFEIQTATGDFYSILSVGLKFFSDLLTATFLCGMLVAVSPLLSGAILAGVGGLATLYVFLSGSYFLGLGKKRNFHESAIVNISQNALRSYREIRLLQKFSFFTLRLKRELRSAGKLNVLLAVFSILPKQALEILLVLLFCAGLLFKEFKGIDNHTFLLVGMIYVVTAARIMPLINSLIAGINQLKVCRNSLDRIFSTLYQFDSKIRGELGQQYQPESGSFESLQLKDVTFTYPGSSDLVLRGVNLSLGKGQTVGIVGASGSGKSTLLGLICGFLEPDGGRLNIEFNKTVGSEKRNLVCFVAQDSFLFNGCLSENISLSEQLNASEASKLNEAINLACLNEVVDGLENGIETDLGQSGTRLSSGQRQRVALARAIYHGSNILILDEATNAIDVETEQKIFSKLASRGVNDVTLVVSHRQSTLTQCDQIFLLSNGKLELVDDQNHFFANQLEKYIEQGDG